MRLSKDPTKLQGVQLGEATINLIRPDMPPLKAKFALLSKEGDAIGFIDRGGPWKEATLAALQSLAEALEAEAISVLFEEAEAGETPQTDAAAEPPQF